MCHKSSIFRKQEIFEKANHLKSGTKNNPKLKGSGQYFAQPEEKGERNNDS